MQAISVTSQLGLVEQQLSEAMGYLNEGDSQALVRASASLQATALNLVQLIQVQRKTGSVEQFGPQVGQLAKRLLELRENLIRRSAYVDRALRVVLPSTDRSTYQSRGPYGNGAKPSGSMQSVSA